MAKSRKRKNDSAWEEYVGNENIKLDGKSYRIDAKKLQQITGREPRLLAKVDEPEHLPAIFRNAGYSLIAVTNGKYLLFKGDIFSPVPDCPNTKSFQPKTDFPLETAGRGTGESQYLDNAFNIGLLSEFTQCGRLYLTIRGRERTKKFNYRINSSNMDIPVDGVQIEVDAGYEGEKDIILLEGKIGKRSSFNIRQLYYPFRHFSQLIPNKRVRPIFFAYDLNRATYSLYEFGFRETDVFDSIYSVKCTVYSLVQQLAYEIDQLRDKEYESVNNIIPQADDLNKILELLTLINKGQNTAPEIADYFVFTERQSSYYGEAAESLGLITRKRSGYELTARGIQFISTDPREQRIVILKTIINSWYFQKLIEVAKKKKSFDKSDIIKLIASVEATKGGQRYNDSTIYRREKTIMSWLRWISEEFESFMIEGDRVVLK